MNDAITRFDPERTADLSIKLILAAGNNDVEAMKRLRQEGADIDFKANVELGTGAVCFGSRGLYRPESATNALVVALYSGAFDAAMYLVRAGADVTVTRKEEVGRREHKALDFLLMDYVRERVQDTASSRINMDAFFKDAFDEVASARRQKNYQTDLYTPAQRVELFDAMVENMRAKRLDPIGLVSEVTLVEALHWARAEMIPKLAGIGVKIEDWHFVVAARPIHREEKSIDIMAAVLPYVKDVNVVNGLGHNAGHEAAGKFNLSAFKWLEQNGLDKHAVAQGEVGTNLPTYAHAVAFASDWRSDKKDKLLEFAQYLVDQRYPIDVPNPHNNNKTPAETAVREGNLEVSVVYINAGAAINPDFLASTIGAAHYRKALAPQIIDLIGMFKERGVLSQESMQLGFDTLKRAMEWNSERNHATMIPILEKMLENGLALSPEKRLVADKILAGESLSREENDAAPQRSAGTSVKRLPTNKL